ncbi:hypothetical protein, partial [Aquitalea magnusonii]|uniref:hypothetical protein n=1 Tax=Aquitalea magnusonii TaxID=332411 RepID=UPI00195C0367
VVSLSLTWPSARVSRSHSRMTMGEVAMPSAAIMRGGRGQSFADLALGTGLAQSFQNDDGRGGHAQCGHH